MLATGSLFIVLALVFAFGLTIGIQAAYGARLVGAPSAAGAFTSIGDLREIAPYAFGYMMAAKVSTGYVAEIGTMRITDEIDALDVMGLDSLLYLVLDAAAGHLADPAARLRHRDGRRRSLGSFISVVLQVGQVSAGGYLELFWKFQSPSDFLFSGVKGMVDGDVRRARRLLLRLHGARRAGRGRPRDGPGDGRQPRRRPRRSGSSAASCSGAAPRGSRSADEDARSPIRYAAVLAVVSRWSWLASSCFGGGPATRSTPTSRTPAGSSRAALVQVAGRKVGTVSQIRVTPDGQADVELAIDDDDVGRCAQGTRATVRAVGQAGIANHFVDLTPGRAGAAELRGRGGAAGRRRRPAWSTSTRCSTRSARRSAPSLRALIANSADVFAGSGAERVQLDARPSSIPRSRELNGMSGELARDRAAIRQVIRSGNAAASAIDSRRTDLQAARGEHRGCVASGRKRARARWPACSIGRRACSRRRAARWPAPAPR